MRRDGGSVFPAHANTGDPNGPIEACPLMRTHCALISMMARSKCSNQRPDTLMQDRSPPARRNHLQRTAGPYIGSKSEELTMSTCFPLCPRTRTLPDAVGTSCAPQADIGSLNRSTRLLDRARRAERLDRALSPS